MANGAKRRKGVKLPFGLVSGACAICDRPFLREYWPHVWDDKKRTVAICSNCKTVALNPLPSDKELSAFYSRYQQYIEKREPSKESYIALRDRQIEEARRQEVQLQKYFRPHDRVCEVGASFGAFLKRIRPHVGSVYAIGPGHDERCELKKLKIPVAESIAQLSSGDAMFDVVAMFHTIEHFNNPVASLKQIGGMLRRGGRIIIETPNLDDPLISLYRSAAFKDFYFRNEHCFYFTPDAMKEVLKRAGFAFEKTLLVQRYGLANHLTWLNSRRPGGDPNLDRLLKKADSPYRRALIGAGYSDTFVTIFRRL